ncbi:di-trans,poly-cis-decaprenylcistransferase [Candidatus Pacearchaeota archaeon]|nr:di-trans,poly-cis-decaprenylcistransferase [Candidatus Pacearchaeota archaeon]
MPAEKKLNHLAIILDGNRRYAKNKNLPVHKGHEFGAKTLDKLLNWCKKLSIKEMTLYVLSTENLKRDKTELNFMFSLFKKWFKKFKKDKRVKEDKVKIRFIGDLSLVPKDIKNLAEKIQNDTKENNNYIVNFCFAYGGRLELLQALNKLKNKKGKITEEDVSNSLWLKSEPELIIRTGNKIRTSNFLPWQSVYSEWVFLEKMWPEFTKQDLIQCIENFNSRQRNFGK